MATAHKSRVLDMTQGDPFRLVLQFSMPLFCSNLLQQLYNLTDTALAGHLLGSAALAEIGATAALYGLIMNFAFGMNNGLALTVSRYFGAGDESGIRRAVGWMVTLSAAVSLVLTGCSLLGRDALLTVLQVPAQAWGGASAYLTVILLGIPLTMLYNMEAALLRAVGNSVTPLLFLLGSTVLNVALDLLFILVFDMGVAGAGWATVLAQLISGIACLVYMIKRFDILHLSRKDLKPDAYSISRLCAMGVPMGLQYSITAIGSILLQSAVNSLGETYMAAVTAGSKVTQFLCCPFDAMGSTMATYCGQNVGAGRVDRIESGVKKCSILGIAYAIIALIVIIPFGGEFSKLFIDGAQTEILDLAKQFLLINVAFYIPLAFVNIIRFSIQGLGNSQLAVFAGVFEMIARGGVALGLVPAFGYVAVCLASPAAWVLADLFLFPAFFHSVKILKRRFPVSRNTQTEE